MAVGLWDRDMLMVHTAHFLPLYAAPSCQHTVSEGHPSSYGGRRQTSSSHCTLREVASITQQQDNVLSAVWQHWEVFWSLRGDE